MLDWRRLPSLFRDFKDEAKKEELPGARSRHSSYKLAAHRMLILKFSSSSITRKKPCWLEQACMTMKLPENALKKLAHCSGSKSAQYTSSGTHLMGVSDKAAGNAITKGKTCCRLVEWIVSLRCFQFLWLFCHKAGRRPDIRGLFRIIDISYRFPFTTPKGRDKKGRQSEIISNGFVNSGPEGHANGESKNQRTVIREAFRATDDGMWRLRFSS